MSVDDAARPWWASDDDVTAAEVDPDPLGRHRAARRGHTGDAPDGGLGANPDAAAADGPAVTDDDATDDELTDEAAGAAHRIDTCGICPVCIGLRVVGEARPDLLGHLTEAARHLTLAMRTVIDAEPTGRRRDASVRPRTSDGPRRDARDDTLTRIDLDPETRSDPEDEVRS